MNKCGKGCMPECEYFTTGGCVSPFNCLYKIETSYINYATSTSDSLTALKPNGTGVATGLYCAKCGTWQKWLNKQEKILYSSEQADTSDLFEKIEQLKAENAELRARLEKAVELPCKVGDMVYAVWCDVLAVGIYETKINEKNIYRMCDSISTGWAFLTRKEAEARLKELRG